MVLAPSHPKRLFGYKAWVIGHACASSNWAIWMLIDPKGVYLDLNGSIWMHFAWTMTLATRSNEDAKRSIWIQMRSFMTYLDLNGAIWI